MTSVTLLGRLLGRLLSRLLHRSRRTGRWCVHGDLSAFNGRLTFAGAGFGQEHLVDQQRNDHDRCRKADGKVLQKIAAGAYAKKVHCLTAESAHARDHLCLARLDKDDKDEEDGGENAKKDE